MSRAVDITAVSTAASAAGGTYFDMLNGGMAFVALLLGILLTAARLWVHAESRGWIAACPYRPKNGARRRDDDDGETHSDEPGSEPGSEAETNPSATLFH